MEWEKRRLVNGAIAVISMVNDTAEYSQVDPKKYIGELKDLRDNLDELLLEANNE